MPDSNGKMRLALVGAGFMGEALLRGVFRAGLYAPSEVRASDANRARLQALSHELGITAAADNLAAAAAAETVVLAVKPQVLPQVLDELRDTIQPEQLVISIAAGVTLATIEGTLAQGVPVVRAMPNLLATVGEAATALAAGTHATGAHLEVAEALFGAVGVVVRVEEKLMDAVTALSGSGPAFLCLVIEALADGGVRAGLPRETAQRLAAQTALGTARLLLQTGEHPAQVKDRVASPGGTTIAGVYALERAGLRAALMQAIAAAAARAAELGRSAGK